MSIRFRCPNCESIHCVADRLAGRRVRCPDCSELANVIPLLPSENPGDSAEEMKEEDLVVLEVARAETPDAAATATVPPPISPAAAAPPPREPVVVDHAVSFGGSGEREDTEMDMTPMVDVTFLLLIFFMVTAAFNLQKSLDVPTPREDQATTQPVEVEPEENADIVTVHVDAYNTFRVITVDWEEEAPSEQELYVKLRQAREGVGGKIPTTLLVRANEDALHQKVVTAMDAGSFVGMERVLLMTVEEDD